MDNSSSKVWPASSDGIDGGGGVASNSGADVKNDDCLITTGHAGDDANFQGGKQCHFPSTMTGQSSTSSSSKQGGIGNKRHYKETSSSLWHNGGDNGVEFIDKLQALPLQCDITIFPRAHPSHQDNNGEESLLLHANDTSVVDNYDDSLHNMSIKPIRIAKKQFLPCGNGNIVRLDSGMSKNENDFVLSLTNCIVYDNGGEKLRLPVHTVPSSLSVPSNGSGYRDVSYSYSPGLDGSEKHVVEELSVSFDFSTALQIYQEQIRTKKSAVIESNSQNQHRVNQFLNGDHVSNASRQNGETTAINDSIKNTEINSIMTTLEEESQFIRKTLAVLGSFGFGILICLVWTMWKLERGRRARRNRTVKKVIVDLPYEIIGTAATTATTLGERRGVISLRSSSSKVNFPNEISPIPIRSSASSKDKVCKAERTTATDAPVVGDVDGMHETLHLIAPQCEAGNSSNASKEGHRDGSPRHWYEDFLSPRGRSKSAHRNRSECLFSEKEEVARSLFCSSSSRSSNKISPSSDVLIKNKSANSSVLNAPEKKMYVTPIERSTFAPSPSDVSLLGLTKRIESSSISPLMVSTETEDSTHNSSKPGVNLTIPLDGAPSSTVVTTDNEESCTVSPVSFTSEESSGAEKLVDIQVNTPKPKSSRILKIPADISVSSQDSVLSTSSKRKSTRESFAEELVKKISPEKKKTPRNRFSDDLKMKKAGLTPTSTNSGDGHDFSSTIERRAADIQTPKKEPKRMSITPLSASSSPPADEPSPFLSDYW